MLTFVVVLCAAAAVRAQCGTSKVDLSCLKASDDYEIPAGSSCSAPECAGGKLPWNIFINVCQPVQTSGPQVANCGGAAICQQWSGDSASLGAFSSVTYADVTNGVTVTGTGGTQASGTARNFVMTISCSTTPDPFPTFVTEDPVSLQYTFTWNRPEACGAGCGKTNPPNGSPTPAPGPTTPSEGLSIGWWVFIFLWVFVAVYFIGGAIFMAVVKGARGVEMVPNLTFWSDLPALVKDGCLFVGGKLRRDKSAYAAV